MEYRVYTYAPGEMQDTLPRKQRHGKRRRGGFLIFRFACLFSLPIFVLLMLHIGRPANLEHKAADIVPDTAVSAPPAAPAEGIAPGNLIATADPAPVPAALGSVEYDFSSPVPVSGPVEDSYFDDAVFIGDSRTEGLILYTGLSNATSFAYKGLMVDTVFTKPFLKQDGQKVTVIEALKSAQFSKVYLMLGINETGWVYSRLFQEKYGEVIDAIRAINPEAILYIQEIMPVSDAVSATHSYITNEKIGEYNALLRELAEEKQVYYIDTGSAVASEDGSLPEDAAADGIHLVKDYCEKWLDYLKTHTV